MNIEGKQNVSPRREKRERRKKRKGLPLIIIGLLLVAAALGLSFYNIWDDNRAAESVETALKAMQTLIPDPETLELPEGMIPDHILNPKMDMPTVTIDGSEYIGYIEVPVLELSLPVLSEWSYPGLKIAPCRYVGSAYLDNLVLAAHNYQRHFGRLNTLVLGDEIRFIDVDGNVFTYTVADMEQLNPTDTIEMTETDWDLTLFTCTIGGQFRFTVRCERVEDSPITY